MPQTKENSLMHRRRRPRARTLVTMACLAGVVPVAAVSTTTASAASYTASSAASCSFSSSKPKGGYFLSLKVTKVSCSAGKSLAKAHDKCRTKSSVKGTCKSVKGYKCTEKRGKAIPTEYSSTVTCKNGSKKVIYSYQQDTA